MFENVDWIGTFPGLTIPEEYKDAEAVIFTAYPFDKIWIGNEAEIAIEELKESLDHPFILRYAGDVDCNALDANRVGYFPQFVQPGHMGILPSAVGFDPIIRLQAGGLKVGEALLSGNYNHCNNPLLELV
jgi:hypothetical protein